MSKYTTQVRWIVEYYTPDFEGTINDRIVAALPHIFNFNFPIYQESYRTTLETKIIKHYYMKEIGLETVQLWKLFLEERLNYIMPYYNKLYQALDEEIKWNIDYDIWEDFLGNQTDINQVNATHSEKTGDKLEGTGNTDSTGTVTQDGKSTTDTTGDSQNTTTASDKASTINSNFPQASYQDNVDYASDSSVTDTNAQGTNHTISSGTSDTTTNSTSSSTNHSSMDSTTDRTIDVSGSNTTNAKNERGNKHLMHRAGLNGSRSYSQLFQEYVNTLMDVDQQIIQNLHDLFMEVY